MQSPYPPRPPFPPRPGSLPGESDRDLVARLGDPGDGRHHAVALLLARHWRATRDYAIVCLAAAGPTAQLVATAAFQQVLGRLTGGAVGGALRPQLLVAVRETVRAWAADESACVVMPELRKPTGGRGLRATMPGTPERRQLAERAFQALPGASQCLLWHTEVEAEPINIPAGLSGVDAPTAATALEQAREQFRAGCVRAHRELAPSRECRFYNRLLDVPIRRGGSLLPDVQEHLAACRHCRHAADQLSHFEGGLEVLLAETVLGWGARRYLDSRPGRGALEESPAPHVAGPAPGGRHRTMPEGRRRTALAVGVGLTSLALLATVLVAKGWSDDNGVPGPEATWGAPVGSSARPGADSERPPAASPSAASVGDPVEVAHGRLRSLVSGLCLDVGGGRVEAGVGAVLAGCSSAGSQQWSYQDDGLLRSAADPTLCLAADPGTRGVVVSGCVVHAGEVSYDLTVRGELLLRGPKGLALAPGSGDSSTRVVVAARDGSRGQRWVLEAGVGTRPGRGTSSDGPDGLDAPSSGRSEASKGAAEQSPPGRSDKGTPRKKQGQGSGQGQGSRPTGSEYETRIAQAGAHEDPGAAESAPSEGPVSEVVSPIAGTVASVPAAVGSLLG
ncbi:RICIN domain-containing protein [Streptomyces sp. Ag109_G2-15]|uniref:RICIN domain-containing protein n=1 Tax=Streptomyces sp. Ag109_G2-15 TaxID=1938850 RepID=UPI000BCB99B8|nr:RICIN domain-containing protein [Streptomyces sp. Ag109_G2-15]SOD88407.1 Ricin-type beta-trefoil lectin domain-containing protein [Streptomyces sp. Ag109_G2-15]